MRQTIAIIMRSKNEMPYVQEAIRMLNKQSLQSFDLYAIDSGSTDGTLETLQASRAAVEQIPPDQYVPGLVLNQGISKTNHDIIVLLNADAIPQTGDWLSLLLEPIFSDEADAVFSRQIARPDACFIVQYDYERAYHPDNIMPGFFSAVACAFKREQWEKHPFRETGYAEDLAWATTCIQSGARFRIAERSVVEHSHNYTLQELYKKRYRQALTFDNFQCGKQKIYSLIKEIIRDLLHATGKLKLHTIPYNVLYRLTIYRGLRAGYKTRL